MKLTRKDVKTKNAYRPSSTLIAYLEEKLHLLKLERKSIMRGEELSDEDKKKKELNQRKKVYVLNHHLFESMANLITFFEFITLHHQELREEFEDEIEELLMGRNKNDKREADAFSRLVYGATRWDYDNDPYNFRLSLLFQMQKRITLKIPVFAKKDFDEGAGPFGISESIVRQDMERAFTWVGLYARNTLKSENQKEWEYAHRPVLF
jgi:competence protein ComGF